MNDCNLDENHLVSDSIYTIVNTTQFSFTKNGKER